MSDVVRWLAGLAAERTFVLRAAGSRFAALMALGVLMAPWTWAVDVYTLSNNQLAMG
jgi:hypothetical protein